MSPTRRARPPATLLATAVAVVVTSGGLLAGCTEDRRTAPAADAEHASEHGSDHASDHASDHGSLAVSDDPDAAFLEQMIPHHRQALDMAELAATRASSPQVRALAARIGAVQAPEILVMADWLADHDLPVPEVVDAEEMAGMTGMQGMLSGDQMDALAAAEGPAFDRLFLTGMVQHHEGAVSMALTVLRDGDDQRVTEIAADVNATQSAEVSRMQALLAAL